MHIILAKPMNYCAMRLPINLYEWAESECIWNCVLSAVYWILQLVAYQLDACLVQEADKWCKYITTLTYNVNHRQPVHKISGSSPVHRRINHHKKIWAVEVPRQLLLFHKLSQRPGHYLSKKGRSLPGPSAGSQLWVSQVTILKTTAMRKAYRSRDKELPRRIERVLKLRWVTFNLMSWNCT